MASSTKLAPSFPPDFCSAETLAHRLDCSVSTVHSYVRRGLLPKASRLGDLVRWRWADVERFIDELENCRRKPMLPTLTLQASQEPTWLVLGSRRLNCRRTSTSCASRAAPTTTSILGAARRTPGSPSGCPMILARRSSGRPIAG